jgi:hypothetical protein
MWLEKLHEKLESNSISEIERNAIELLIEALNDWPDSFSTVEDFISLLEKKIGGEITLFRVQKVLNKLNPIKEAWAAESLTSVKQVLELFPGKSLREIAKDIMK